MSLAQESEMASPSLLGWIFRDTAIVATTALVLKLCSVLVVQFPSWWVVGSLCSLAFVLCYLVCYIVHEWGHYLGALLTGIKMPLAPYKGFILGQFRIDDYSSRQYLALSWGGDLGHVLVTVLAGFLYFLSPEFYASQIIGAFFVGGLAFSVQALAVDQAVIWRVIGGADMHRSAEQGTTPQIILRRTWQTWIPLGIAVLIFNFA